MPDSGTIRPTLTSAGCCARARPEIPTAAAPERTVRRVSPLVFLPLVFLLIFSPCSLVLSGLLTYRDRPCGPDRRRAAFRCCLRAQRVRLRGRSRGRPIPAPPPRAARPAAWSGRIAGGYR